MSLARGMSRPLTQIGAGLGCALALAACGTAVSSGAAATPVAVSQSRPRVADGDWLTFDYNAARTGVGPAATGITARNAASLRLRVVALDGTVDSSPVQLSAVRIRGRKRDVVFVTTTYGKTIAIDPRTGTRLWEFTPSTIGAYAGSPQVTTATPVADPDRRYVYTASPDGFVHKLTVSSGHQVWATRTTYDATHEKLPASLNINGADVIVTTGGYIGDAPPYQGHVVAINRKTGRRIHVWNSLCSDRHNLIDPPSSCPTSDSAIWGRAGAVVEPGSGKLLIATGNGTWDGHTNWGDSALELTPNASGLLQNWTPNDQAQLNANDKDIGSTSPALLPGGYVVQGGKNGLLTLINLNRMNGRGGARPITGGELQALPLPGGADMDTAPVVWPHGGRVYVFVATDGGTTTYVLGRNHRLSIGWQRGTPGTSPVLAGGLLYIYDEVDGNLLVRNPISGIAVATLPTSVGHWNSPIVVGGRVILPVGSYHSQSTSGQLDIFHLPGR